LAAIPRNKNPNIKGPNVQHEYTYEQLAELRKCKLDPVYFIDKYVKIQHPTRGIVPFRLRPYQERMLRGYQSNRFTVVLSARQTGKEQPHSAQIYTPTGYTTMGKVFIGDEILTPDGKSAKVIDKFPQGIKDIYKITFDDGSFAESGIDHLWTVDIRNKWVDTTYGGTLKVQRQTLTLREIIEYRNNQLLRKNAKNYNVRIPLVTRVNFNKKDLPLDPYVLGLLLGDGSISKGITFTSMDEQLVEELKEKLLPLDINVIPVLGGNNIDYRLSKKINTGSNNKLLNILRSLKLHGTVSDTKFIPEIYKHASHEQRLALLQGLMDTDGTCSKKSPTNTTISYCTTSPKLRDDVLYLVRSLGGKCSFYEHLPQNPNHKISFDVFISLPNPKSCFRLQRKKDLCHDTWGRNSETEPKRTIVNIQLVRQEEASCILIDHPDHLYITDNFTVTHNSVTSGAYLLWYATFHKDKTVLIASNKNSNAMEMIHRIRLGYENLPMWLKPGIKDDGWNKHSVGFDNGTRIISEATSENSGRGLSISLLYLDEFAHVAKNIQEEFWTSIEPTLSTGGDCIMTSTPNGDIDIFAQIWRGAAVKANGFFPIEVKWDEPPGRDGRFKEETIGRIGEQKWKQEYECVHGTTLITIRDTETGEIQRLTIEELYKQL
jgi:hypothetical protein